MGKLSERIDNIEKRLAKQIKESAEKNAEQTRRILVLEEYIRVNAKPLYKERVPLRKWIERWILQKKSRQNRIFSAAEIFDTWKKMNKTPLPELKNIQSALYTMKELGLLRKGPSSATYSWIKKDEK